MVFISTYLPFVFNTTTSQKTTKPAHAVQQMVCLRIGTMTTLSIKKSTISQELCYL